MNNAIKQKNFLELTLENVDESVLVKQVPAADKIRAPTAKQ